MCQIRHKNCFQLLKEPKRIWAVPAIHGDIQKLTKIHDAIHEQFEAGDHMLYFGNYTGYGEFGAACIDEVLTFRRLLLCIPGVLTTDFTYLRGRQEEVWQRLLQLQFAPNPTDVLLWMLSNGISNTLYSYGLSPHDGIEACSRGVMDITKWTNKIRQVIREHPGHDMFSTVLNQGAHTPQNSDYPMLFVHAGLNAAKALEDQGDSLWWAANDFEALNSPYLPFQKVLRGYDPDHKGYHVNGITATLDDGCGFGGMLVASAVESDGAISQTFEA